MLFRVIVQLKLKQLRRYFSAKRKTDNTHTHPVLFPLDRSDTADRQIHLSSAKLTGTISSKSRLLLISGQTVDQLRGANRKTCGTQEEKGTGRPGDQESDREPAA
jgi:hypothetical protein